MVAKKTTKTTEKTKVACTCCGKEKELKASFYVSSSVIYKYLSKLPICKDCTWKLFDEYMEESKGDEQAALYRLCKLLDFPYFETIFASSVVEARRDDKNIFKTYIKNVNSLSQYSGYTFENGDSISNPEEKDSTEAVEVADEEVDISERDKQNEIDVTRIIGYDPFENENGKDRKFLFNRLVDMLDDSVVEDNVKLMSVISIVKGFNQVEYVDMAIARVTADINNLSNNNGNLKSLIDAKKNLMSTILKTCEDNGISTKFNTNKSKGSGTLTGMIKKLGELDLDEAKVNLFDIQTSQGMEQVADLSHASIMKQLQFDENDYADMVAWQKDEIYKMTKEKDRLEEELRLLRISLSEKEVNVNGFN